MGGNLTDWEGLDFVFVPAHAYESIRGVRPDLALNVLSFEEMPGEQVGRYTRLAWELGVPFFYSFNGDSVREVLGRYYWLHEVPLLELEPSPLPERLVQLGRSAVAPDSSSEPRHVVGWRRAST
jgi:hypothetical protein